MTLIRPFLIVSLVIALGSFLTAPLPVNAQTSHDRPWELPNPILVLDPYEGNSINWSKVRSDSDVKAVIHRAFFGTTADSRYEERIAQARDAGLLVGIYLLGRPGDPIRQADLLVEAGATSGVSLLALDIENMDASSSMTLADAEIFITRVHERTGRYPLFYTNFSTFMHISRNYSSDSVFSKAPLWIARFRSRVGTEDYNRVWSDYTLWQFQSEINCKSNADCFRRVKGTKSDMDVNIFNGTEADLHRLFGN